MAVEVQLEEKWPRWDEIKINRIRKIRRKKSNRYTCGQKVQSIRWTGKLSTVEVCVIWGGMVDINQVTNIPFVTLGVVKSSCSYVIAGSERLKTIGSYKEKREKLEPFMQLNFCISHWC